MEASSESIDAMLSQMDIIYAAIDNNDVNDATVDAEVEKLLATSSDQADLPQRIIYIGNRYRKKGKYERAIHFYDLVSQRWPGSYSALNAAFEKGKTRIEQGDHEGVQVVMDEMIADFNDHAAMPTKLAYLGDEYFYDHDYPHAISIWQMVLDDYPGRGPRLLTYLLGAAHERMKNYGTAAQYYERSLREHPSGEYAYRIPYRLGIIDRRLKDYEQAIHWFGEQPKLYSDPLLTRRAKFFQGIVYLFNMEDYEQAAGAFREYVEQYPDAENTPLALYDLALCSEKTGDKGRAIALLKAAIELRPDGIYAKDIGEKLEALREEEQ